MRLSRPLRTAAILIAAPLMWGAMSTVHAVGTAAGTNVNNTATLSFSVGGVPQTDINSNTSTFTVDNRVDITVAWQDASPVPVASGQTQASVMTFRVTNTGNALQDFALTFSNDAGDQFDPGTVQMFVEDGTTPGYQAAEDTATFVDELAADDGSNTVFATVYALISNIPGALNDGDQANVNLIAQARESGAAGVLGAVEAEDTGADTAGVDTVWGDGAGTDPADGTDDGFHSDQGTAVVVEAQLTVNKAAVILRDPFSGATNPKAIPGATVRYTITITNAAAATGPATLNQITDALVATVRMDPDLNDATGAPENAAGNGFRVDHVSGRTLATPAYYSTAADGDADHDGTNPGGTVTATWSALLPAEAGYGAGQLLPGDSVSLIFNVIIE